MVTPSEKNLVESAKPFIAARLQHLSEIAEDYVELIDELIQKTGEARTCDLAIRLGVSHVTVVRTLQRLQQKGYVRTEPHKPITLTKKGKQMASICKERHSAILEYLISIGVPEEIAAIDAEGMEHHVSKTTLEAFHRELEKKKFS